MLPPAVPSAALGRWLLATASLAGRPSLAAHYAHADIENAMSAAIWLPENTFRTTTLNQMNMLGGKTVVSTTEPAPPVHLPITAGELDTKFQHHGRR